MDIETKEQKQAIGLTQTNWEELLRRWSRPGLPAPETRLACAVIASGIQEELRVSRARNREPFSGDRGSSSIPEWCSLIGVDWGFVKRAVSRAHSVNVAALRSLIKDNLDPSMIFAREVIDLLAAFPGREWRMAEIVNHVARGRPASRQQRDRYRQGVRRVMLALIDANTVEHKPARRGGTALYKWKCDTQYARSD